MMMLHCTCNLYALLVHYIVDLMKIFYQEDSEFWQLWRTSKPKVVLRYVSAQIFQISDHSTAYLSLDRVWFQFSETVLIYRFYLPCGLCLKHRQIVTSTPRTILGLNDLMISVKKRGLLKSTGNRWDLGELTSSSFSLDSCLRLVNWLGMC